LLESLLTDGHAVEDRGFPHDVLDPSPEILLERGSMRLWHLAILILALGIVFTIVRDPVGRIGLIVFITALGEVVIGVTAVMALFQTIGAIGMARGLLEHSQAVVATTVVLFVATAIMSSLLFIGAWLVQAVLP
jgi:hypothetical protein